MLFECRTQWPPKTNNALIDWCEMLAVSVHGQLHIWWLKPIGRLYNRLCVVLYIFYRRISTAKGCLIHWDSEFRDCFNRPFYITPRFSAGGYFHRHIIFQSPGTHFAKLTKSFEKPRNNKSVVAFAFSLTDVENYWFVVWFRYTICVYDQPQFSLVLFCLGKNTSHLFTLCNRT